MNRPNRPSDDLLLQLIRDGKHDSEIAVRLGVTTGDLRERKTDLRNRLGAERYARAIDTATPVRGPRRRWKLAAIAVAGSAALAVLLGVANLLDGGEEQLAAERVIPAPTARPTPGQPAEVAAGSGSQRFHDAGQFLTPAGNSGPSLVARVENREALSIVYLHGEALISPSEFADWVAVAGQRGQLRLRAPSLGGRAVSIQLNTGNEATRIRRLTPGIGPVVHVTSSPDSIPPILFVRAFDDAGQQLSTEVTADGRLHVSLEPLPAGWVIDRPTGTRIDTSEAVGFGRIVMLSGVGASTYCDLPGDGFRCGVTWTRAQALEMPGNGIFSCTSPAGLRFEANGIRLDFSLGFSATRIGGFDCEPETLPVLTRIIPDLDWDILATSSDGQPLSIGVTREGALVVGAFRGEIACPCLTQP